MHFYKIFMGIFTKKGKFLCLNEAKKEVTIIETRCKLGILTRKKIQFETYSFLLGIGMYGHLKGSHRTSFDMIWLSELCEIKIIVCIISCLFTNGLTPIHSVLFDFFESLHLTFPWALFGVQIFLDHRSPILGTRCIWGFRVIHWLPENKTIISGLFWNYMEYKIWLTSFGPVLTSYHSVAEWLILSLGSSQETPKYIEMDIVWKG